MEGGILVIQYDAPQSIPGKLYLISRRTTDTVPLVMPPPANFGSVLQGASVEEANTAETWKQLFLWIDLLGALSQRQPIAVIRSTLDDPTIAGILRDRGFTVDPVYPDPRYLDFTTTDLIVRGPANIPANTPTAPNAPTISDTVSVQLPNAPEATSDQEPRWAGSWRALIGGQQARLRLNSRGDSLGGELSFRGQQSAPLQDVARGDSLLRFRVSGIQFQGSTADLWLVGRFAPDSRHVNGLLRAGSTVFTWSAQR